MSLIYNKLERYDNTSRFLLTTEGNVTDPTSLRRLLQLGIQTRVYNPRSNDRGFHLKSYLFAKEDSKTLIIGSSNISSRAFGEVHEMAVEIDAKNEGKIVSEYTNNFDLLWDDPRTCNLTEEFIEKYEKIFN